MCVGSEVSTRRDRPEPRWRGNERTCWRGRRWKTEAILFKPFPGSTQVCSPLCFLSARMHNCSFQNAHCSQFLTSYSASFTHLMRGANQMFVLVLDFHNDSLFCRDTTKYRGAFTLSPGIPPCFGNEMLVKFKFLVIY